MTTLGCEEKHDIAGDPFNNLPFTLIQILANFYCM
jgi:hypothetical protein